MSLVARDAWKRKGRGEVSVMSISPGLSPFSDPGCPWNVSLNKNLSLGQEPSPVIRALTALDSESDLVVWLALG